MFKSIKFYGAIVATAVLIAFGAVSVFTQGTWTNVETLNVIFEGATRDANELTLTVEDPSADRTVTIPNATGSVGVGYTTHILLCGDLENNGTNYLSPAFGGFANAPAWDFGTGSDSWLIGGDGCSAEDDTTEATADEIMFVDNAFKVLGLMCEVDDGTTAAVVISLREDAAELTPAVGMTIALGDQTGVSSTATTADIAANSTFALKTVTTTNESSIDIWCMAKILVLP